MYPHKAHQKISVFGLTVKDLLHWLQNVPKCRDVQLLVVHDEAGDANLLLCFVRVHQLWSD